MFGDMAHEMAEAFRGREWVGFPLDAAALASLEGLIGFGLSPLLREFLTTPNAMVAHEDVCLRGANAWAGNWILEKNRDIAEARERYEWDLPKLIAITNDEDFLAVTEDGEVVQICGNEGNIDRRHGDFEAWLGRYAEAARTLSEHPNAASPFPKVHGLDEDPEAQYD